MSKIQTKDIQIYKYNKKGQKTGEYLSFYDAGKGTIDDGDYYKYNFCCAQDYKKVVTARHFGVRVSGNSLHFNYSDMMNSFLNEIVKHYRKFGEQMPKGIYRSRDFTIRRTWETFYLCKYENDTWKGLPHGEFEKAIRDFLEDNPQFEEVEDLNEYKQVEGIYFLILDDYNQCYLGQSNNIKKRIQSHWSKKKAGSMFDRFKALDTTRVYAWRSSGSLKLDDMEIHAISQIDNRFLLNVFAGGTAFAFLDKSDSGKKYSQTPGHAWEKDLPAMFNIGYIEDINDETIE